MAGCKIPARDPPCRSWQPYTSSNHRARCTGVASSPRGRIPRRSTRVRLRVGCTSRGVSPPSRTPRPGIADRRRVLCKTRNPRPTCRTLRERIVCLLPWRRVARPRRQPSQSPRAHRAARRVSRSLSSLVVLRAHSASPGAVPARLVRAHANAAVDAAPAVTDRLAAASGSDAEFLLGVAARVVSAQSANRAGALTAGDGARVAAAVGDAKVGGAARALPAAPRAGICARRRGRCTSLRRALRRRSRARRTDAPPPWEEHRPPTSATRVHPERALPGDARGGDAIGVEGGRPRRTLVGRVSAAS